MVRIKIINIIIIIIVIVIVIIIIIENFPKLMTIYVIFHLFGS